MSKPINKIERIHENDSTLAHVAARSGFQAYAGRLNRNYKSLLRARSVKEFYLAVRAAYAGRVLGFQIKRELGSRAFAEAFVLDTNDGDSLCLIKIDFNARLPTKSKVLIWGSSLVINLHAIARAIQRTTGSPDTDKAIVAIMPHVLALMEFANDSVSQWPFQWRLYGQGGCLAGAFEDERFVVKTWMPAARLSGEAAWLARQEEFAFEKLEFDPDAK
jgi:hypothetical protein